MERVLNLSPVEYDLDLDEIDSKLEWLIDPEKKFSCQFCQRKFKYKHVKENHEKIHTGEKPFQCELCLKSFRRSHHLQVHMRLHTGELPFQCYLCDRKFRQRANYDRHLKRETLCVQNVVETETDQEPQMLILLYKLSETENKST